MKFNEPPKMLLNGYKRWIVSFWHYKCQIIFHHNHVSFITNSGKNEKLLCYQNILDDNVHQDKIRSIGIIVCSITVINLSLFISIFTFLRKEGCCYESHLQVVELICTMSSHHLYLDIIRCVPDLSSPRWLSLSLS